MKWNKRYERFATQCGLRPASEKLERWILCRAKPNQVSEMEIDLRTFNQEIALDRRQGGYDRKTLKEILAQLDEKTQGLILITKSYSWAVHKILVRPIDFILEKKSPSKEIIPKSPTGEPMYSDDHKNRARELLLQNISKLDTLCRGIGMKLTPDNLMRIWRLAGKKLDNVQSAIKYMLICHANKVKQQFASGLPAEECDGIHTPEGWLHECLQYGWHLKEEFAPLPVLQDSDVRNFVDSLLGASPPHLNH
jgi:hypothetical protein